MTEIKKTSAKVMIGGKEVMVNKLKAGKYYQAQQIFIGLITKLQKTKPQDTSSESKEGEKPLEKLPNSDSIANMFAVVPQEVAKLVAFCVDLDAEKLLEDAYPEELTELTKTVIELNNFNENLKNSVAPMENLGAVKH